MTMLEKVLTKYETYLSKMKPYFKVLFLASVFDFFVKYLRYPDFTLANSEDLVQLNTSFISWVVMLITFYYIGPVLFILGQMIYVYYKSYDKNSKYYIEPKSAIATQCNFVAGGQPQPQSEIKEKKIVRLVTKDTEYQLSDEDKAVETIEVYPQGLTVDDVLKIKDMTIDELVVYANISDQELNLLDAETITDLRKKED